VADVRRSYFVIEVAALKVLLMPLDGERVVAADDALADDPSGAVTNRQEVLIIEVPIEIFVLVYTVPTGGNSLLQITQSSLTSSVISS